MRKFTWLTVIGKQNTQDSQSSAKTTNSNKKKVTDNMTALQFRHVGLSNNKTKLHEIDA